LKPILADARNVDVWSKSARACRGTNANGILAGRSAGTTMIRSELLTGATATKSRISWKGLLGTSDSFVVWVFDIISSV